MKYILRIKAVSQCMGIRRATLAYSEYNDKIINLADTDQPLKKFKNIEINNNKITYNGSTLDLVLNEEIYFYLNRSVNTGNSIETEQNVLGIMLMELHDDAISYYEKEINDGYMFDQWNGEFEFIIGLIYSLVLNNKNESDYWFNKALDKNFKYGLI